MRKVIALLAVLMIAVTSFAETTPDYLRFTGTGTIPVTIKFSVAGTLSSTPTLQYSPTPDVASSWQDYEFGTALTVSRTVSCYFRAKVSRVGTIDKYTNSTFSESLSNHIYFSSSGNVSASGNIMSLLDAKCGKTEVPDYAFCHLFSFCTGLKKAPSLPATTVGVSSYDCMFQDCTALTAAPALPATTLDSLCYRYMFQNCTTLTAAPELPATNLAYYCYCNMFDGCSSITAAPFLPATTLAKGSYCGMFNGCKKLADVSAAFTDWKGDVSATTGWLEGVSETGTFYCPASLDQSVRSATRIPEGWNIASNDPVCFTAVSDISNFYLVQYTVSGYTAATLPSLLYSTDGINYSDYKFQDPDPNYNSNYGHSVTLKAGEKVYFKAKDKNETFSTQNSYIKVYSSNFPYTASGNVMSLLDASCHQTSVPDYAFHDLFYASTRLTDASKLQLPATTLGKYCYDNMFFDCSMMTAAPELPATKLSEGCYYNMFYGCSVLNSIKVHFTSWNDAAKSTYNWVKNVASTGTFTCPEVLDVTKVDVSHIPEGWSKSKFVSGTIGSITRLIDVLKNKSRSIIYDLDDNDDNDLDDLDILVKEVLNK